MKKLSFLLALLLILSILPTGALAVETGEPEQLEDCDEFIIKLSDNCEYAIPDDCVDEIYADQGLYLIDDKQALHELIESGVIEYIEPNGEMTLFAVANDTYYSSQWGLSAVDIETAWATGLTGAGVRVGIIDSGINSSHSDLKSANIATGYNVLTDTTNVKDSNGHGTIVAGIIAATINNSSGIAGIADGVTLVPIKCFDTDLTTSTSDVIEAIMKATYDLNCDVINLSLGSQTHSKALEDAVNAATNRGVIVVAAVGNKSTSNQYSTLYYPAACDNVIGVGSISKTGTISSFSLRNPSVYVTAPGSDIISLSNTTNSGIVTGKNGTSFSAPFVTALAALAKEYDASIDLPGLQALLAGTSTDYGDKGYDTYYGYGVINAGLFARTIVGETFLDIQTHWGKSYIEYCASIGVFNGTGDWKFSPDSAITRGMVVTALYRLAGSPSVSTASPFKDVSSKAYYAKAVAWANSTGITVGTSKTAFSPNAAITREQLATFLMRFAEYAVEDTSARAELGKYTDCAKVSAWATEAIKWAVAAGIISGTSNTTLSPKSTATRAQVATMLARYDLDH